MDINGLRSYGLSHETGGLQPWRVPQTDGAPAVDMGVGVEPTLHHRITGTRLAPPKFFLKSATSAYWVSISHFERASLFASVSGCPSSELSLQGY